MKVIVGCKTRLPARFLGAGMRVLAITGFAAVILSACTTPPAPAVVESEPTAESQPTAAESEPAAAESEPTVVESQPTDVGGEAQTQNEEGDLPEIVVYAFDLPESALSEFEFWEDPASPNGTLIGYPNFGSDMDPPPEDDPNVIFNVNVRGGIPYRCWIHMKVGAPRGISQANKLWVQFSNAVDEANNEVLRPGTGSYLTVQGPEEEGWTWVSCDQEGADPSESLVYFPADGETTVRIQIGMEGVGFDQFVLSPAQFLEEPPSEAIVEK